MDYSALEEDFKGSSKVGPYISPDLDVDIVSVNVNKDIDRVDSWDDATIWQSLSRKLKAKTHIDGVHDDIGVACSDENPLVTSEVVSVESGGEVIAGQLDLVVSWIDFKNDVLSVLRDRDVVLFEV